jgi:hypothetical protein
MGKDLTSMIEEINNASSSLNKSSKSDDPVSGFLVTLAVLPNYVELLTSIFSHASFPKLLKSSIAIFLSSNGLIRTLQLSKKRCQRLKKLARASDPADTTGSVKRLQMTSTSRSGGGDRLSSARTTSGLHGSLFSYFV